MRIGFGDCVLDTDRHELRRDGEPVPVEPQVFDVLAHLVEHRDRMVPKTELLDEIWGDRFVSESALTSRIKSARKAVGDTGRDQRMIKTVHGHGYRFVAPVADDVTEEPTAATDDPVGSLARRLATDLGAGRGSVVEVEGGHAALAGLATALRSALPDLLVGGSHADDRADRHFGGVLGAVTSLTTARPALLDAIPASCREELARAGGGRLPSARPRLLLAVRAVLAAATAAGPALLVVEELDHPDAETTELVRLLADATATAPLAVVIGHTTGPAILGSAVVALAGPAEEPSVDAAIDTELRGALAAIASGGTTFDDLEVAAATGAEAEERNRLLDAAFAAGLLEAAPDGGYRFTDVRWSRALAETVPPHRRAEQHRATARRLLDAGAAPARIADHLQRAGDHAVAVPHVIAAARQAAAAQLHGEVLDRTASALPAADDAQRFELLSLRADALAATGSPDALPTYRSALAVAPRSGVAGVRARMARLAAITGDQATARDAIEGLAPDGGPDDGLVLLATAVVAFFDGDLDRAEELLDDARRFALEPGAPAQLLDIITLRGLIAHDRGEWFDQLNRELRAASGNAQLAATISDSHLCVAEFLLYGPTPYDEVVTLAAQLRRAAEETGALPAAAFATCLAGEAELLAGDLDAARADLGDAVARFRALHADAGLAHALQRLAEVELASGDPAAAVRLAHEALPLARWSAIDRHLVQRTLGTLITASPDPRAAAAAADDARRLIGERRACEHCEAFVALPAAMAYAEVGRLDDAHAELRLAEQSVALWEGVAMTAALDEARAVVARAEGDPEAARALLGAAAGGFARAGHVLDAERCTEAMDD